MKLRDCSKLITQLAKLETGAGRVHVELGLKSFWHDTEEDDTQRDLSEAFFVPVAKDECTDDEGREWQQDLADFAQRDEWVKLNVPADQDYVADFYIYVGAGAERELDSNVVVTFSEGVPVYATGTSGKEWDITMGQVIFRRRAQS